MSNTEKTISFRAVAEKIDTLDALAAAQDRSRSYLINEAITNYIELHAYQNALVHKGLEEMRKGRVVSHEEIVKRLKRAGRARQRSNGPSRRPGNWISLMITSRSLTARRLPTGSRCRLLPAFNSLPHSPCRADQARFPLLVSWSFRIRPHREDRKSTRLNSSHLGISYAVF